MAKYLFDGTILALCLILLIALSPVLAVSVFGHVLGYKFPNKNGKHKKL